MLNQITIELTDKTITLNDLNAVNVIIDNGNGETFSAVQRSIQKSNPSRIPFFRRLLSNATMSFFLKAFSDSNLFIDEISLGVDDIFINKSSMRHYFSFGDHVFKLKSELLKKKVDVMCVGDPASHVAALYLSVIAAFCGVQLFVIYDENKDVSESFVLSPNVPIYDISTDGQPIERTTFLDESQNCRTNYVLSPFVSDDYYD